jgi:hypothetical protein
MSTAVRRWLTPAILVAIVLLGGAAIAWLQPAAPSLAYLSPGNTGPDGGHALADILAGRGEQVSALTTITGATTRAATILVTSPQLLTAAQLKTIGQTGANLVLVDPDAAALTALAPGITPAGQAGVGPADPGCTLPAATLAGHADLGGTLLRAKAAQQCYRYAGHPSLVQYTSGGRRITVLGTGAPFTNQDLGNLGNAALALNLLGAEPQVDWLTPAGVLPSAAGSGPATFTSLIPKPVYMVTVQLLIAVLFLALWRVRRLGPLVAERLPAVVRAAETTEGHGRLYHARRARDRAADVLRTAAITRLRPRAGLPPDATPEAVAAAIADRTDPTAGQALTGPPPADDAGLVALADRLDDLERKVAAR